MKARPQPLHESSSGLRMFLRIRHPSMNPSEITRTLSIEPEQTVTAGAAVSSAGVRRLHSESYWIAELPVESITDLVAKYRARAQPAAIEQLGKEQLLLFTAGTPHDVRILLMLKAFEIEANEAFLQQVNREGGSVTLLVNRGEDDVPFVVKVALPKLGQLGIALEID